MIRLFDILISCLALLFFSPLLLIVVLVVALTHGFPIFFTQIRVGKNFKPFRIYKFRSMKLNAEDELGLTTGFSDTRITKTGYFLRKYKIDEFPQLFNVLKGDMSLVGSRPQVQYYTKKFNNYYSQILIKKPGLFSPAATFYNNEEELLDKVDNPTHYYETVLVPIKCMMDRKLVENFTLKTYFGVLLGYVKKSVLKG